MICKKCGGTIDIQKERSDGSLQCPYCRTIYRPRVEKENNTQQIITIQKKQKKKKEVSKFRRFVLPALLIILICFALGKDHDTSPVRNPEQNAVQDVIMTIDSNEKTNEESVVMATPSPEYDTLQRMFVSITEKTTPTDIEQFIGEAELCYTIGEYNQSSPGKSIVYRVALKEGVAKQKYADSGDYLEVAFDGGQNKAFKYAHYVNADNIGYTALLYNYGTWYDFRCDQPGEYSGYYINNSFGKDKGITITYNNGNTVNTNYFKYDSAEAVINEIIASLE